jgi:hypothetical protein
MRRVPGFTLVVRLAIVPGCKWVVAFAAVVRAELGRIRKGGQVIRHRQVQSLAGLDCIAGA